MRILFSLWLFSPVSVFNIILLVFIAYLFFFRPPSILYLLIPFYLCLFQLARPPIGIINIPWQGVTYFSFLSSIIFFSEKFNERMYSQWIFCHKRNPEDRWYPSFSMAFSPILLALGLPNASCFLSHRSVATFVQNYSSGNLFILCEFFTVELNLMQLA